MYLCREVVVVVRYEPLCYNTLCQRKLECEKADFQTHMSAAKRALETEDTRIKEEEKRLQRLKDELAR